MPSSREVVLCRYHYDPLDRLVGTSPLMDVESQRFYCKSRLATEIQGLVRHSIFQHDDQLLAQQQHGAEMVNTTLLATDQQRSVLHTLSANPPQPIAYSPYGHRPAHSGLLSLLGFNGERWDPVTGHYLLGNGYRAFNPVLMRFNSPDSLSPFGDGGLNPYVYCLGDPINRQDPTGHIPASLLIYFQKYWKRAASTISKRSSTVPQTVAAIANKDSPIEVFDKIVKRIGDSARGRERYLMEESDKLSQSNSLIYQLDRGRLRNAEETSRRFDFYTQHADSFNFKDGVPQNGQPFLINNGPDVHLYTDHFNTSIGYYFYKMKASSGPELEIVAAKLRASVINRDEHIVMYTQSLEGGSIRGPRGGTPVGSPGRRPSM
ncbi:MAG: RHS repeat-associated core domain-containing protein [Pseudomonas sp.]|nr:RHS repeat-associated core domain-containing protein [Pseudomonas sp.]